MKPVTSGLAASSTWINTRIDVEEQVVSSFTLPNKRARLTVEVIRYNEILQEVLFDGWGHTPEQAEQAAWDLFDSMVTAMQDIQIEREVRKRIDPLARELDDAKTELAALREVVDVE